MNHPAEPNYPVPEGREMSAFLRSFSEGIVLTDASLSICWVSPMAENLLGIYSHDWTGKPVPSLLETKPELAWIFEEKQTEPLQCWEVMQCDDQGCPLWRKHYTDCWTRKICPYCSPSVEDKGEGKTVHNRCAYCKIYNSYAFQREREITRPNSEKTVLQVSTTPLFDENDSVIGSIRLLRDVTQDRELGQLKDDFLSALAHELRSPLTSIRSYTEILLHYADTDPETQKEFLRIIHAESERLDQMIEDMMELQQFESARSVWNNKEVYMPELIQRVLRDYRSTLKKKAINYTMEMDSQIPNVWTDSDKLYHVVFTLLRTLANQTAPGGTIRIRAFPMKGQRKTDMTSLIKFSLSTSPPKTTPAGKRRPSDLAHGETPMGRKKALSLGFTLCKAILDQYGGNLWMENGEGTAGQAFHFTLPSSVPAGSVQVVHAEEETEATEERIEPFIEKSNKRILIVDDEPGPLNALTFALQREGYRVHSTTSVRRALEMLQEAKPDLIISDIRMPELDGYAFFQHIQEDESTKNTPFIFISGKKKESTDMIQGLKTGVDDYFTKPFKIKEILARVEVLLGRVERYKELSRFDNLTGALNRKAFEEHMDKEILKAQREGSPMSVVMADLDHFKSVNDTHGHLAGDFVLRAIVDFFKKNLREEDVLSRYGGEEFCIIMPGVRKKTALDVLDRIRRRLAETHFYYEKGDLHIALTCSFGVSDFPKDSASAKGLIEKADAALYQAKNTGRNRVATYGGTGSK